MRKQNGINLFYDGVTVNRIYIKRAPCKNMYKHDNQVPRLYKSLDDKLLIPT